MQKLLEVNPGEQLASGLFPGLDGKAPVLWRDGYNVLFDSGRVRKDVGYTFLASLDGRPTGIAASAAISERRTYLGIGASYYMYRSSDGITRIATLSASGGVWQFAPAGSVGLATNGSDPLSYFNSSLVPSVVSTPFGSCRLLRKYYDYFLAAGTNLDNNVIYNSCFADPTDWTNAIGSTAGNRPIRDLKSGIAQLLPLGNVMGVYTADELHSYQLTGDVSRFAANRLLSSVGAISPYSVVDANGVHYGMLLDSAFKTDGGQVESIDDPAVRRYMQRNFDTALALSVYGWHDVANKMVRWWLPSGLTSRVGLGYRYEAGTWTRFLDDFSVGLEQNVWPYPMVAGASTLYRRDTATYDIASNAMPSWLETKPLDCGQSTRMKQFEQLELDIEFSGNVRLGVGFCQNPRSAIDWVYDMAVAPVCSWEPREAPYIVFKIYSNDTGCSWELNAFRLHGEVTGYVT